MASNSTASASTDSSSQPSSTSSAVSQQPFLRFQLDSNLAALLPVSQLAEILRIPTASVVPVPDMSAWVMGVYNWRGEILWVVDIAHLVGRTPWYRQPQLTEYHAVIVSNLDVRPSSAPASSGRVKGSNAQAIVGLAVHAIDDIETYDTHAIQPASDHGSQPLASFSQGYWVQSNQKRLPILSGSALRARLSDDGLSPRLETIS